MAVMTAARVFPDFLETGLPQLTPNED